jgi:hypothetical protein
MKERKQSEDPQGSMLMKRIFEDPCLWKGSSRILTWIPGRILARVLSDPLDNRKSFSEEENSCHHAYEKDLRGSMLMKRIHAYEKDPRGSLHESSEGSLQESSLTRLIIVITFQKKKILVTNIRWSTRLTFLNNLNHYWAYLTLLGFSPFLTLLSIEASREEERSVVRGSGWWVQNFIWSSYT